jgi:hypothetical protein
MRRFLFAGTIMLICALGTSFPEPAHAADLSVKSAKQVRVAKSVVHRRVVKRDPCYDLRSRRFAARLDQYDYSRYEHHKRAGVAYFPGDAYNGGYCLSLATGPRFHPGWAWGW